MAASVSAASVWVDKEDYSPGESVLISGAAFNPGSTVQISITRPDGTTEVCPMYRCGALPVADGEGSFHNYVYVLNGIVGSYTVTAFDGTTTAYAYFTDARLINSVKLNGASSVTVSPGATITVLVNVTTTGSGNDNDWESTWTQIEGQSSVCNDTADHTTSGTYTETVTITAPSTAGVYDFSVRAYDGNTCTAPSPSAKLTLTDAITVQAIPVCGDGIINGGDACDDGNTANGDGCSSTCAIENGWECAGQPSVCKVTNPPLLGSCGVDMVLIIDDSGSIDSTELTQMKTAFKGFADAFLPNTPTQIAVVDFDTTAQLLQGYSSNKTAIKNAIDAASGGGYTNWDDALREAYAHFDNRADKPDVYIFASDGNPNRYGDSGTAATEAVALSYAVQDANQIKLSGIRIITLGIGNDLNPTNLQAISSSDAYYATNFDTLATTLAAVADELCGGTVTVKKYVDDVPASGWEFSASVTGGTANPTSGTTDAQGYFTTTIEPTDTTATVAITETIPIGSSFVSVSCTDASQNPVGTPGQGTVTGISVSRTSSIYCEFRNTAVQYECRSNSDCDNGLYCDGQEYCDQAYTCQPGTPVDCSYTGDQCNDGVCSEDSDSCVAQPKQDGTQCDDGQFCYVDDSCYKGQCMGTRRDCSGNDIFGVATCGNDPDNSPFTYDFRAQFTSVCDDDTDACTTGDDTITHTCADADPQDGGPMDVTGAPLTCTAACDGYGTECQPNLLNDICYYNGACDSVTTCACTYTEEYCPVPGTVHEEICYYGTQSCTERGCSISSAPMGCKNTCDPVLGPIDTTGPVTDNLGINPNPIGRGCRNNFSATAIETCTNISDAEYYVQSWDNPNLCTPESGLPSGKMSPSDGTFDELVEDVYAFVNATGLQDGGNYIYCARSKNQDGAWGECACRSLEVDTVHPVNMTSGINNIHWSDSYGDWVCADNFTYSVYFCDQPPGNGQSCIARAEYIIWPPQNFNLTRPGMGHAMFPTDGFFGEYETTCDNTYDNVTNADYSEGTHQIKTRAQDCACNWGKIDNQLPQKIVIDRTAPLITKSVSDPKFRCDYLGDEQEAGQCYYINQSTTITLNANDVDNAWDHVYSDSVTIHYRYRYKVNYTDSWGAWSNWVDVHANTTTFSFQEDSIHEIEYYVTDRCGNPSAHFFEIDIVDSKPPITTKDITGPQLDGTGEIHKYLTQDSVITLTCNDQQPHPIGGEVVNWAMYWKENAGDEWQLMGSGTEQGSKVFRGLENSYHKFVYYCADALGNTELPHTEIDVVDNQAPVLTKLVGEPNVTCTKGQECHYFVTNATPITITCVDQQPHPVGNEVISYHWNLCDNEQIGGSDTVNAQSVTFQYPQESCHELYYECKDALNNTASGDEVDIVDLTPPKTTKELIGPQFLCSETDPNNCHAYITQATQIQLTCEDQQPHPVGKDYIKYRYQINDGEFTEWMTYEAPFTYPQDSRHTLEYYCVDLLGNTEATQVEVDIVDTQAPNMTKIVGDPKFACDSENEYGCDYYVNQSTPITITCEDGQPHPVDNVTIYYRWDMCDQIDGPKLLTVAPYFEHNGPNVTFNYPSDSCHALYYWCQDSLGNAVRGSEVDIVDSVPPEVTKTITGPQVRGDGNPIHMYLTQDSTIKLECNDPEPHPVGGEILYWEMYWSYDNLENWQLLGNGTEQSGMKEFTNLSDSYHKFVYYCADALGNTGVPQTEIDAVDNQAPSLVKILGDPKVVVNQGGTEGNSGPIDVLLLGANGEDYVQDVVSKLTGYPGINSVTVFDARSATPTLAYMENYDAVLLWSNYVYADKVALGNVLADYSDNGGGVTTMVFSWYDGYRLEGRYMTENYGSIPFGDYNPYSSGTLGTIYDTTHPVMNGVTTFSTNNFRSGYSGALNPGAQLLASYSDGQVLAAVHEFGGHRTCDLGFFPPSSDVHSGSWNSATDGAKLMGNCLLWTAGATVGGEEVTYITQDTTITFNCTDLGPHPVDTIIVKYRYNVDGGEWTEWMTYNGPFTFTEDSKHTLEYYCVDALNNSNGTEANPHVEVDKVDSTPPRTVKTYGTPFVQRGETKWITSSTPITLDVTDGGEICHVGPNMTYYNWTRVDDSFCYEGCELEDKRTFVLDGTWTPYTGPFTITEDSCHMITYYSVDKLGNVEMVKRQCTFVDNTAPETNKTIGQPSRPCREGDGCHAWVTNRTDITLSCVDSQPHPVDNVTLYYRYNVDGGEFTNWTTYTGPIRFQEDSVHYLEYYCADELGNTEVVKNETDKVDNTPPTTYKILDGCHTPCLPGEGCDYWINSQTKIGFSPVDGGMLCAVGVDFTKYKKDGGMWYVYNPNHNITLSEGTHTLKYYSVDLLGNTELVKIEVDKVDNDPPHGWVRNPVSGRVYHDGETFLVEAPAVDEGDPASGVADCSFSAIDIHFENLNDDQIDDLQFYMHNGYSLNFILHFLSHIPNSYDIVELQGITPYDGGECRGTITIPQNSGLTDKAYLLIKVRDRSCNEYYEFAREYANGDVILMDFDNDAPRVVITDRDGLNNTVEGGHRFTVFASIEDFNSGPDACWGELYFEQPVCHSQQVCEEVENCTQSGQTYEQCYDACAESCESEDYGCLNECSAMCEGMQPPICETQEVCTTEEVCNDYDLVFLEQYTGVLLNGGLQCRVTGTIPTDVDDGGYTFTVAASDEEYNIGNDSVRFTIDTQPPVKSLYSPVTGTTYGPSGIPIIVGFKDISGIAPESVQYRFYAQGVDIDAQYSTGGLYDSGWRVLSGPDGTTYDGNYSTLFNVTAEGLTSGSYFMRVRGCDNLYVAPLPNGSAIPSHCMDPVMTIVLDLDPPVGPTNVVISDVQITWTAATDALSGIDHYNVYNGDTKIGETTTLAYTVNDTSATYFVSAVDRVGNEGSKVQAQTPSSPPPSGGGGGGTTPSNTGYSTGSSGGGGGGGSGSSTKPPAPVCQSIGSICSTTADCCEGFCMNDVCTVQPTIEAGASDPIDVVAPELVDTGSLVTVRLKHHFGGAPLVNAELDILSPSGEVIKRTTDSNGEAQYSAQQKGWYKYELPSREKGSMTYTYSDSKSETPAPQVTGAAAPTSEGSQPPVQPSTGLLFGVLAPELAGLLVLLALIAAYLLYRRTKGEE